MKDENPKMKLSEITNELGCSSSTLRRYKNDVNLLSPYRNQPKNTNKRTKKGSNTNFDNNQHLKRDFKRPQMTSNDIKKSQSISESSPELKSNKSKGKLKGGANNKINGH